MSEMPTITSTRLAGIGARLDALHARAQRLAAEAQAVCAEMAAVRAELDLGSLGNEPATLKRSDGRLNDAGIQALFAAFAGGMNVVQAARQFDITPSAASTRRKVWLASRPAIPTTAAAPQATPESAEIARASVPQIEPESVAEAVADPVAEAIPEPAAEAAVTSKPKRQRSRKKTPERPKENT